MPTMSRRSLVCLFQLRLPHRLPAVVCAGERLRNIVPDAKILAITGVSCAIVAELVVQVITWRKLLEIHKGFKSTGGSRSLHSVFLRDGT